MAGSLAPIEEDEMASQDGNTRWKPVEPVPCNGASIVASAPVEVVAEIGRITLRGDELAGLTEGGVLDLGPRPSENIHLRVGGLLWATGDLIRLGEHLGVRILRIHR